MSGNTPPVTPASTAAPKAAEPETIKLVAVERGFTMGRLIHPGEKFDFRRLGADGQPRKLPKWAQLAEKPLPPQKRDAGDLKPKAAQAAVKAKAGALSGNSEPLA